VAGSRRAGTRDSTEAMRDLLLRRHWLGFLQRRAVLSLGSVLGCLVFFSLGARTFSRAQQLPPGSSYEGQPVVDVTLVARPSLDVDAYQPLVVQKAGEPYSEALVQKSISALMATRQFSKVTPNVTPESGGLRIQFIMEPAYYIGTVTFPGAQTAFSYPHLIQVVNFTPEDPYEKGELAKGKEALEKFFAHNGYFQARVDPDAQLDEAHKLANVIYHVQLNRLAKVGDIDIAGPPPSEVARLKASLGSIGARLHSGHLTKGQKYNAGQIDGARRFLQDQLGKHNYLAGKIELKPPEYDPESNLAALHLDVTMGPMVAVRVTGAHIWNRTLKNLIPIYQESSIDQDLIDEGQGKLTSYFQDKGYFDAKVTSDLQKEGEKLSLTYNVQKGGKHRVEGIKFAGNKKFDSDDLLPQVTIKKAGFLSHGLYSQDRLKKSVSNLEAFYRNAGYADVKVTPKVADPEAQVDVTFDIKEGEQTIVEAFNVEGNRTQNVASLVPDGLEISQGLPYSQYKLDKDRNRIIASYLNLGYPAATFKSSVAPVGSDPHRVATTYLIDEGPQVHVSQVMDVGEKTTRPWLLDRSARLKTGDPLSEGKMLEGESRLYNRGIFDWADVSPRRAISDQTAEDVLVRVHEAKRNSVTYGVGFQSTPRSGNLSTGVLILPGLPTVGLPKGFAVIQKTVFTPLGSIEYSRLNLRGLGETGSVSLLGSTLHQRAAFNYSQPHFARTDWHSLWSVSAEKTTENPLFNAQLGTASIQLERTLDAARTRRLQLRYDYKRTLLSNLLIQHFVPPEDLGVNLSTLSASYVRDTRDKPLDAHKGMFQTLDLGISPSFLGSTDSIGRYFAQTSYYRQVTKSVVWANSLRLGGVMSFGSSHVPFSERFFSGGADSLRGFALNGAGPQQTAILCTMVNDPSTCTAKVIVPTGGRQLVILNSEARFPLGFRQGLGGVVFYDGGNVYQGIGFRNFFSDFTNTVGFGLRYQTPVGPIRIDLGHLLNSVPGQKSTQVFITVGQAF